MGRKAPGPALDLGCRARSPARLSRVRCRLYLGRTMSEQTQIEAFAEVEPAAAERPPEPAIRVPLRELEDGQRVYGVYAVRERELRRKRNGEPWLRLSVGDATGTAEAVCWEEAEALYALCRTGSPVFVTGVFEISERWGAKIKLSAVREAEPHENEAEDLA